MRKLHSTRKLLLALGPLDDALLAFLRAQTGKKDSYLLREGLKQLAMRSERFSPDVFEKFVKQEWLPDLKQATAEKLERDLEVFLGSAGVPEGHDDMEFDSKVDFA